MLNCRVSHPTAGTRSTQSSLVECSKSTWPHPKVGTDKCQSADSQYVHLRFNSRFRDQAELAFEPIIVTSLRTSAAILLWGLGSTVLESIQRSACSRRFLVALASQFTSVDVPFEKLPLRRQKPKGKPLSFWLSSGLVHTVPNMDTRGEVVCG